jgi:hypothetical protein
VIGIVNRLLNDLSASFGGKLLAMPKDFRSRVTVKKKEDATASKSALPPEIAQLIEGYSVCIDPKRYFSKTFRATLPLIQHRLEKSSRDTFTLKPELFEKFMSRLRLFLEKKTDPAFKPSDCVSFVLVSLATGMDVNQPQFDSYIDPEGYWETLPLPDDLIAPAGHPTSSKSEGRNSNTVSLNVALVTDEDDVDSLEISISGEPLRAFFDLEAGRKMAPAEKRALQRRAKAIWKLLSNKISSRLGIEKSRAGRPLTDIPKIAAFLRDHCDYTLLQIAQLVCTDKQCKVGGKHTVECRDRLRNAANLHWKHEKQKYEELARAAQNSAQAT